MIYTELTKKALKLCYAAHRDQVDKSGMPYVFHPFHLAEQMEDEITAAVALLHDVVEDTEYTLRDLEALGFPPQVLEAVGMMTHDPAVPYLEYAAKLRDNMTEIDPDTAVQPLSVAEHEFHEGSSVKKIGGKYYYLFTDTHRHGGRATSLGYAVSDYPDHGFRYGGIVIDNFGCDPKTWNNHGSLCEFRGQWYVFYHRSTHAGEFSRHVCAEPIQIEADGSIREVKMTSGLFSGGERIPAYRAAEMAGSARIAGDSGSDWGFALTAIHDGDRALFRSVSFDGEDGFTLRVRTDKPCRAEVYLDGRYAGCVKISPSDAFASVSGSFEYPVTGVREAELRFYGEDFTAALDSLVFNKR